MTSSTAAVFQKKCIKAARFACCGVALLQGVAHAEVLEPVAVPEVLQGVWAGDDHDGRAQCERYRALADPWQGDGSAMVGMLMVTPTAMQKFSEYGEGDFYQFQTLDQQGAGRWQGRAWIGIDVLPDPGEDPSVELRLQLEGKRLSVESAGDGYREMKRWWRCSRQLPGDPQ